MRLIEKPSARGLSSREAVIGFNKPPAVGRRSLTPVTPLSLDSPFAEGFSINIVSQSNTRLQLFGHAPSLIVGVSGCVRVCVGVSVCV